MRLQDGVKVKVSVEWRKTRSKNKASIQSLISVNVEQTRRKKFWVISIPQPEEPSSLKIHKIHSAPTIEQLGP